MIHNKRVVVVMPAYNAEKTLPQTHAEIDRDLVDEIILVDDASSDKTTEVAKKLGIVTLKHIKNRGYGGNQKTCYQTALERGADIVVMLHPDYQYTPRLIPAMAYLISSGLYDAVLGSRVLVNGALKGGMPRYKYVANRILTFIENLMLGQKLSEYHTGYRAFNKDVLMNIPLAENSDDFVFDNEMLAQIVYFKYKIGEISCPANYFEEASSINFKRSSIYGLGVLWTSVRFFLNRLGLFRFSIFNENGKRLRTRVHNRHQVAAKDTVEG